MPYPTASYRFTFLHSIPGTDERAVTDLRVAPATPASVLPRIAEDDNDQLEDIIGAYITLWKSSALITAAYGQLDGIKVAPLDAAGEYTDDAYTSPLATPVQGTGANVVPSSSVVISLRSGSALGKGNYGRMYLPYTQFDTATGSVFPPSGRTSTLAGQAATFIEAVNTAVDTISAGLRVAILGQTGTGTNKAVAQVAVGRITDTQRRRRNALTEDYAFASVA